LKVDGWLVGREWELWRPLAAIAKLVGEEDVQRISETISRQKQQMMLAERMELQVLKALAKLVQSDAWYSNRQIREAVLEGLDEEERIEVKKMLTAERLGRIIGSFGFEKRRVSGGYEYYLSRDLVLDLAWRWGITVDQASLDNAVEHDGGGICELCGRLAYKIYLVRGRYACEACRGDAETL